MAVENVTYISSLDPTAPAGGDSISEGDDHIRNIKKALTGSFPNVDGPVDLSTAEFALLKSSLSNGGIVASCKYNGSNIMYQEGISSVTQISDGNYTVAFESNITGFDQHYAPIITPFISPRNRLCVVALQGFTDTELTFSLVELVGDGTQAAGKDTGFSLLIVDMIQS
jgi:hypothetical protein